MYKVITICVVLIVLLVGTDIYRGVAINSPTSTPEVRSAIAGYCLDDHHDGKGINVTVDLWTCNGTAAQNWITTANTIKRSDNYCLGVLNNGKSQGDKIVSNTCNKSPGQQWTVDLGGYQNPSSGLCLDTPSSKDGTQLILSSCNNLSELNESWAADIWTDSDGSFPNCNTISQEGPRVACYAEYQWQTWQSEPSLHGALLNDYSDGNAYEEWCADFISYVYMEAGYPFSTGERGTNGWDEYNANNLQYTGLVMHSAAGYTPKAGDVAFFDYPGGHVEIVYKGGKNPIFVYGDSGTVDPNTNNGDMNEDMLTSDGSTGQVTYYLSPS